MLDPHRTFAAGTHPGEPRVEPRAEPRAADREERLLRALRARVRRVPIERAPASLHERVRTLLVPRS